MSQPQPNPFPLSNPAAGMARMDAAMGKLLKVSKADLDKLRAKERAAKGKKRGK